MVKKYLQRSWHDNLIVVQCTVNEEVCNMLVDTGAEHTSLWLNYDKQLHLNIGEELDIIVLGSTGDTRESEVYSSQDKIILGDEVIDVDFCQRISNAHLFAQKNLNCLPIVGIIGIRSLRKHGIEIDTKNNTIYY